MQFLITEEFSIVPCGSPAEQFFVSINICFSGMQIIHIEPYDRISVQFQWVSILIIITGADSSK